MKNNEEDDLAWLIYSPCNALTASNFYAVLCGFIVCAWFPFRIFRLSDGLKWQVYDLNL